jgi:hypothetical protein
MGEDVPVGERAAATGQQPGSSVSCAWCGAVADSVPVTWTVQSGNRGLEYLCESCTRDNVRKIEGSLPTEYW